MIRTLQLAALTLLVGAPLASQAARPVCAPDNAGLTLQPGFCALLVAESIGPARHLVVLENGDLLVAIAGPRGGIRLLRDTTGDGKADIVRSFGVGAGTGIAFAGEYLYFATNNAIVRWHWNIGQLDPGAGAPGTGGGPDTIVSGLTMGRTGAAKSIVVGLDGQLYVNIGAPSNSCQVRDRARRGSEHRVTVRRPARSRSTRRHLAQAVQRRAERGATGGRSLPARGR